MKPLPCCGETSSPCSCEIEAAREMDFFLRCKHCDEFPCECEETFCRGCLKDASDCSCADDNCPDCDEAWEDCACREVSA